ncbi:MAG: RNA polymerase sigma factor [bacterium]|nr:RNA polymerase sigma factor [bacterium]
MIVDDDQDQVLVKKILEGNSASFEELMKKYNRYIFNYVYKMVKDREVATELTQDFFIRIYRKLDTYIPQYKFSSWAYRVCYNMVLDYIRKNNAAIDSFENENVTSKAMMEAGHYHNYDGYNNIEKDQLKNYTWKIVDRLPVEYRELVLLRYVQSQSYQEISTMLDLPLGTIKNKLYKAKKLLRKEIEQDGMLNRYQA